MKTRNLLLTSVLTAAVIGLMGTVLVTGLAPGEASAAGLSGIHGHGHQRNRSHFGGGFCAGGSDKVADLASAYLNISLDLNDTQQSSLAPVIEIVARWHAESAALCDTSKFANAPAALGEIAGLLSRSNGAMDELVPAFEAFYSTLTAEQQATLNSWINHDQDA